MSEYQTSRVYDPRRTRRRRRMVWIVLGLLFIGSALCSVGFVMLGLS